ncbi:MAG: 2-amino-4-hydroxy-6-hydroxymethyldihydropteridine diphosphokinase [Coraliomargaritaceae bacterium]
MPLKTAYIALGGNLGDRFKQMGAALEQLETEVGIKIVAVSPVYQNPAVGMGDAPDFLNAVVRIYTDRSPGELLDCCLAIETRLGRVRNGQTTSRSIDLDLLLYENVHLDSPHLQIPHPRIQERDFVARPLMDLDPDLVISGRSIQSILAAIPPGRMVLWPDSLR